MCLITRRIVAAMLLATLACAGVPAPATAADRHEGYYYPPVDSTETYRARAQTMPDASRETRLGFIIAHTAEQAGRHYAPRYALFAKGADAEKLIIIGLHDDSFASLYRARGVLAQMTARARASSLFRNLAVEDYFTFFDLAKMLGFTQITVSDGESYTHQIAIE